MSNIPYVKSKKKMYTLPFKSLGSLRNVLVFEEKLVLIKIISN